MVTVRSHKRDAKFAEVCVLLKEEAAKEDLFHGMMVAHCCRSMLEQEAVNRQSPAVTGSPSRESWDVLHNQSVIGFLRAVCSSSANHVRSFRTNAEDRRNLMDFRLDILKKAIALVDRHGKAAVLTP